VHKYRESSIPRHEFTSDEIGRIVEVVSQELSPECRSRFQRPEVLSQFGERLQVAANNASWPRPDDRPATDAKRLRRLEDTASKFIEQLRLAENRHDLFAAKLRNSGESLIAARLIGRDEQYSKWLDQLVMGLARVQGHAAAAAEAAEDSEGTPGPNEAEYTDLLMNLMHARCLTTGEEPPAKKSEVEKNFGQCFAVVCEILDVPADKRSLSKLVDRYWGSLGRRTEVEAKIKRQEELKQLVEVVESAAVK
jgi:hypothetical protein